MTQHKSHSSRAKRLQARPGLSARRYPTTPARRAVCTSEASLPQPDEARTWHIMACHMMHQVQRGQAHCACKPQTGILHSPHNTAKPLHLGLPVHFEPKLFSAYMHCIHPLPRQSTLLQHGDKASTGTTHHEPALGDTTTPCIPPQQPSQRPIAA